jgi:hypothetical protein
MKAKQKMSNMAVKGKENEKSTTNQSLIVQKKKKNLLSSNQDIIKRVRRPHVHMKYTREGT